MALTRVPITGALADWLAAATPVPSPLQAVYDEFAHHPRAEMMTHPEVGRLLSLLTHVTGGTRVLEVGTFVGISALWMATSLAPGGQLDTLEISEEHADTAERTLRRAGLASRVSIHRGAALTTLAHLPEQAYDLAYLDALKREYPLYLDHCLRLLRPGGIVVADNVFLDGRTADEGAQDADVLGMRAFVATCLEDPRLVASVLPLADGILVATRQA